MHTDFMITSFLLALAGFAMHQPAPGLRVSMVSLGVRDMARSILFYGETLGLPISGKPGEVTLFRAGEIMIALNQPLGRASGDNVVGALEVIFPVESVTAAHKVYTDRGCRFLTQPRELFPSTWGATFTDPDGHKLTLLGPK
ncbi:MAG: VOC family protein [Acidobacteria bacterium]|nr:VOC family protein [Acidobacteriota bacterium]